MYAMERQELIERLLLDEGRVSVIDLARRFEVTTETVRRDLDQLERIGALRRVHGGALPVERVEHPEAVERGVEVPQSAMQAFKSAVKKAANKMKGRKPRR